MSLEQNKYVIPTQIIVNSRGKKELFNYFLNEFLKIILNKETSAIPMRLLKTIETRKEKKKNNCQSKIVYPSS